MLILFGGFLVALRFTFFIFIIFHFLNEILLLQNLIFLDFFRFFGVGPAALVFLNRQVAALEFALLVDFVLLSDVLGALALRRAARAPRVRGGDARSVPPLWSS